MKNELLSAVVEMLGAELSDSGDGIGLVSSMAPAIKAALAVCTDHARLGVELPFAYFSAGRLCHLLEISKAGSEDGLGRKGKYAALGWYARGIFHFLKGDHDVSPDVLANESCWLKYICSNTTPSSQSENILRLLDLAQHISKGKKPEESKRKISAPVLIIAGGADTFQAEQAEVILPLLRQALLRGTIISGGTTAGVPGYVGDVAGQVAAEGKKHFRLLGYLPGGTGHSFQTHPQYDETICVGTNFGPEQVLQYWTDILASEIDPAGVLLLGFDGGDLSGLEFRVALALGATAGLIAGPSGAAKEILEDPIWASIPNLLPLAKDPMAVRAFVAPRL